MSYLEFEIIQQKISVYENIINNCLVDQNPQNFNQLKEELFQQLVETFKRLK